MHIDDALGRSMIGKQQSLSGTSILWGNDARCVIEISGGIA